MWLTIDYLKSINVMKVLYTKLPLYTTDIDHKPRIDKIQFNEIRIMKANQIAVNRKEN